MVFSFRPAKWKWQMGTNVKRLSPYTFIYNTTKHLERITKNAERQKPTEKKKKKNAGTPQKQRHNRKESTRQLEQNHSEIWVPISGDGVEEDRLPVTNARLYRIHVRILLEPTLQKSETSESEESPVMSPSVLVTDVGEDEGAAKKKEFCQVTHFCQRLF